VTDSSTPESVAGALRALVTCQFDLVRLILMYGSKGRWVFFCSWGGLGGGG